MNLVLYGFKRVGKTTYGKELAKCLKWPFVDTDDLIREAYQKAGNPKLEIHEIHAELKEEGFRALEEEVILNLNVSNFIISVGGGTVIRPSCQEHLKKLGKLIYLIRTKEQTKRALSIGRIPSYLDQSNFEASFEKMYQKREPIYKKIADYSLDVSSLEQNEIIDKLLKIADQTS